jgi:hypothetical protein
MATFTSIAGGGNWNASATWGKTGDPAVEGTDYPGNGDTVVIASAVATPVILNGQYPASGTLSGGMTINANCKIAADPSVNTKLNFGDASITNNGTCEFGKTTARIAAGKTCLIIITPSSDGGQGLLQNGTFTMAGQTKDHIRSLAADVGGWATYGDVLPVIDVPSITLDQAPSGWLAGDVIVVEPTGRTYSHWDTAVIQSIAGAVVTVGATWRGTAPLYTDGANARPSWNHQGEGTPTQARARVLNLTRNAAFYSATASLRTYINLAAAGVLTMDSVEIYSIGYNAAGKYGITLATVFTGTCALTNVALHDSNLNGLRAAGTITTDTLSLTNCLFWTLVHYGIYLTSAFSGTYSFSGTYVGNTTGSVTYGFYLNDVAGSISNCGAVGCNGIGWYFGETGGALGAISGLDAHSNASYGAYFTSVYNTPTNPAAGISYWRNGNYGIYINPATPSLFLDSPVLFGNVTAQIGHNGGLAVITTPNHVTDITAYEGNVPYYAFAGMLIFRDGTLRGTPRIRSGTPILNNVAWNNYGAPTFEYGVGDWPYVIHFRHNATPDDHRAFYRYGQVDSHGGAYRHTASGLSWQAVPSGGAAVWLKPIPPGYGTWTVPAAANVPITCKVWVWVDGTYNGTAKPRIVCLGGILQGVAADVVGTSHSGAQAWEELTVTVTPTETGNLILRVEGQGSNGSYYLDDASAVI